MSRDELFLVKIYEFSLANGNSKIMLNFMKTGKIIGFKEAETKNIVKKTKKSCMRISWPTYLKKKNPTSTINWLDDCEVGFIRSPPA